MFILGDHQCSERLNIDKEIIKHTFSSASCIVDTLNKSLVVYVLIGFQGIYSIFQLVDQWINELTNHWVIQMKSTNHWIKHMKSTNHSPHNQQNSKPTLIHIIQSTFVQTVKGTSSSGIDTIGERSVYSYHTNTLTYFQRPIVRQNRRQFHQQW